MVTRRCREFKPTQVEGCRLWLRADNAIKDGGGNVTSWTDNSRFANSIIVGGTSPTKEMSVINGKPVVRFSADGYLKTTNTIDLSGTEDITVFIVFQTDNTNTGANKCLLEFGTETLDGEFKLYSAYVAAGDETVYTYMKDWSADLTNYSTTHSDCFSNFNTWCVKYLRSKATAPEEFEIRKDGYSETLVNWVSADRVYDPFANTNIYIGASVGGTQEFYRGDIAEIIIYDSNLSTDNTKKIEHYLMSRYRQYDWTPLDNPNITRWWDPTYGKTFETGVRFWDDRRYGTRLTQVTGANQPRASTTSNNRAAVYFNGVNYVLDGKTSFTWNASRHLFLVCSIDTDVPASGAATIIDGSSDHANRIFVAGPTTITFVSNAAGPSLTVATDTWYVIDMVVVSGSPYIKAAINGAALTTGGTTSTVNCSGIVLGEFAGGGYGQKFTCADVICCNSELSSDERAQLINWLKTVNGIS